MNKQIVYVIVVGFTLAVLGGVIFAIHDKTSPAEQVTETASTTAENCTSDDCLAVDNLEYPAGKLPSNVADTLLMAIDDEYKAKSTYESVISKFGGIRPFIMIVRAEESHIASLKSLFDKYGQQIPVNPYSNLEPSMTLQENCQVGVAAEIANVALYRDDLLDVVAAYPDIASVYTSLMEASRDKHLPAFERCAN